MPVSTGITARRWSHILNGRWASMKLAGFSRGVGAAAKIDVESLLAERVEITIFIWLVFKSAKLLNKSNLLYYPEKIDN